MGYLEPPKDPIIMIYVLAIVIIFLVIPYIYIYFIEERSIMIIRKIFELIKSKYTTLHNRLVAK